MSDARLKAALRLHRAARLAEAEALYRAVLNEAPEHPMALQLLGMLQVQAGRGADGAALLERAVAADPTVAAAHLNLGLARFALGRMEAARESFQAAADRAPELAEAHHHLGRTLNALRRPQAALESFERALAIQPDNLGALANRATALVALGQADAALADLDRVLAIRPDLADAHNNRGAALAELGRNEEALLSLERALALRPDDAEARWNQALILLRLGRYAEGWPLYEARKARREPLGVRAYPQPAFAKDQPVAGRTLFLHAEQGLGDTLQFVRYAPLLAERGAQVFVSVQASLVRLLKQLEPQVTVLGPNERPRDFDAHAPLLSLPLAFGTSLETIPPSLRLLAEPALIAGWSDRLGPPEALRVGLAWRGSPDHVADRARSISLAELEPLLACPAEWISLQADTRDQDRQALARTKIRDVSDGLSDFAETAALVATLDLVITVDTSVAHLAGAMDKPVWVLLPFNPDWRWLLHRDDSPWHTSARLFRQPAPGDWASVVRAVRRALDERLAARG